jgi:hypothetical protein
METIINNTNNSFSTENQSILTKGNKYDSCIKGIFNNIKFDYSDRDYEDENDEEDTNSNNISFDSDEFDISVYGNTKLAHTKGNRRDKYIFLFKETKKGYIETKVSRKELTITNLNQKIENLTHEIGTYEPVNEIILDLEPYKHLSKEFETGHIKLKLVCRPSQFSTTRAKVDPETESFLMDLRRNDGEYIIMYPGKETKIEVLDIDNDFTQLLLSVKEPERKLKVMKEVFNKKLGKKIERVITSTTKEEERLFLIGKDEGHLFVAQIKEVSATVKQAHKSLKPDALRKWKKNFYRRQGEWFFVPKNNMGYKWGTSSRRLAIGVGRPHIAQMSYARKDKLYVCGTVTHPDHKTIYLIGWHQVFVNNELRRELRGLSWID